MVAVIGYKMIGQDISGEALSLLDTFLILFLIFHHQLITTICMTSRLTRLTCQDIIRSLYEDYFYFSTFPILISLFSGSLRLKR